MLIENDPLYQAPLSLSEILVVTFTRAATRDLRIRVRACLEEALNCLRTKEGNPPDYLLPFLEQENDCMDRLKQALFCYDEAQIMTIHGFCAKALKEHTLEGDIPLDTSGGEDLIPKEKVLKVIRDFFRTGLIPDRFSQEELKVLWDSYKGKVDELESDLVKLITQKTPIKILHENRSANDVFAKIAHFCQHLWQKYVFEEELIGPDEWLSLMERATRSEEFCQSVRKKYHAAIIDEFQDTDPLQWEIFRRLFLHAPKENSRLYLVGDPKQSIYAFRQADIYTYLQAAKALGVQHQASLDTNYRSQPSLVTALNLLFSPTACPGLFPLPRIDHDEKVSTSLEYRHVQASSRCSEKEFRDNKGSVHFLFASTSESSLYSHTAVEIHKFNQENEIPFRNIAILVRDRYQGAQVMKVLQEAGIPAINQRGQSLSDSPALRAWQDLLAAVNQPRNQSLLKLAMGSVVIGWTQKEIEELQNPEKMVWLLSKWQAFHEVLINEGFTAFYDRFVYSNWLDDTALCERMLKLKEGATLYQDFRQIGELLMEHETQTGGSLQSLLNYLDDFEIEASEGNEILKMRQDPTVDAVNILSSHMSKGLEYDIVFAVGLAKRLNREYSLIQIASEGEIIYTPASKDSDEYKKYLEELDAEKMRQLYVAMTRSKYRVYLPVLSPKKKSFALGEAAPIELFLARLGRPHTSWSGLYERIAEGLEDGVKRYLSNLSPENYITFETLSDDSTPTRQAYAPPAPLLQQPKGVEVPQTKIFMTSFSALVRKNRSGLGEEQGNKLLPPHDFEADSKTSHTLPSGSEAGNLLHRLLEIMPFELIQNCQDPKALAPWVCSQVANTSFKGWEKALCEMLFKVFKIPLVCPFDSFALADIQPNRCFRELEFLYPDESGSSFLKGQIDAVFQHKGRTYLIDWKSNWLGPDDSYYSQTHLHQAMLENQYYLQASIYTEAWHRYSTTVGDKLFDEQFGGVFYLFLRGPSVLHFMPKLRIQ